MAANYLGLAPHFECWMDEDGLHVWQRHVCEGVVSESMLPRGQDLVKYWHAAGGIVMPSIDCRKCGLHEANIPIHKRE